jgi:hypothetical protein
LAAGAPTGMKEYIEFNLATFKAADKAVTLVEKHTDDIEDALMEIDKIISASTSNKSSILNDGGVYGDMNRPNEEGRWVFGK